MAGYGILVSDLSEHGGFSSSPLFGKLQYTDRRLPLAAALIDLVAAHVKAQGAAQ